MTTAESFAPAKINLTLHVTGQRDDGYHLLDSLVVFGDVGDHVHVRLARDWSLVVTGPKAAGVPCDADNLVLRAARFAGGHPCAITLEKNLPIASGIGGGSSDAAACLRALHRLDGRPIPDGLEQIGADLPVCMAASPTRMSGIGEVLQPVPTLPPLWVVLVNPGLGVATGSVFRAMRSRSNPAMAPKLPDWHGGDGLIEWLAAQRNDLEPPACLILPEIPRTLDQLRKTDGCKLARMSGSGATCFGLFTDGALAEAAAETLRANGAGSWVAAAPILS
ncbi:4-(cytidine 5'-diphospho)-2-C-methyl-D-erythritol kinase [Oceaniglobus ichthyenteri]|uniref:4-(cytidine 5'-diphospho)-2-C-methyl-D-erythritol kinase n=1 Tax=Oceaniglobus ichthyenteri TaxID=2136177 RepID=UPI000D3B0366|nr:4-(cytidine 5'-diphospho)-2-C-methyl-D-erythritol kinase [Oceaniglobus ichthyenteri]